MRRKNPIRGFAAFIIFVAIVAVSGYALMAAGYIDDPFQNIAYMSSFGNGGEGGFEAPRSNFDDATTSSDADAETSDAISINDLMVSESTFELPALESSDSNAAAEVEEVFPEFERGEQGGIDWSSIGDVVYDWWFIAATTVVFIVIQQVFKFSSHQFKTRLTAK